MKRRCDNPQHPDYYLYGGRGIRYDANWNWFISFWCDMGPRPEGRMLERRDNNKGYGPDNCYWATPSEQQRNRRKLGTCQ